MRHVVWGWVVAVGLAMALAYVPMAASQELTVYTVISPPLVMERELESVNSTEGTTYYGFEVNLWEVLFQRLRQRHPGLTFRWQPVPLLEIISRVEGDPNAIGIGGVSITAARQRRVAFSPAYFTSGLDVLGATVDTGSIDTIFVFRKPFSAWVWAALPVMICISGWIVWFLEHPYQPKAFPKDMLHGFNEGFWYCWYTMTGMDQHDLFGLPTRMYQVGWSLLAIIVVASYTANLTQILTNQAFNLPISSVSELGGEDVATVAGSTSEEYLRESLPHVNVFAFPNISEVMFRVGSGELDFAVFDIPSLKYFASQNTGREVLLLGSLLRKEHFGVVTDYASPYRQEIAEDVQYIIDVGTVANLYDLFFNNLGSTGTAAFVPSAELTFVQFAGLFIVVGVSLVLTMAAFYLPTIYKYFFP